MDYSLKDEIVEKESKFLQSNALLSFVVILLVLKIFTILISINLPVNIFFADITKSSLEIFVNQTRQAMGLQPLLENDKLNQAAQLKAENMVQNNYFEHTSPSGVSPWFWFAQAGYKYKYAGENLAIGFYDSQEVYNAWLNSPSHRANIVNPNYTEVGTAVVKGFGANNSIVVVQEFGSQIPIKTVAKTSTPKTVASQINTKPAVTQPVETKTTEADAQTTADTSERVLSQSTELIQAPTGTAINTLGAKLLNYFLYNYNGLIQDITYGVSLIVIGILMTFIFFNFKVNLNKALIYRAVLILVLLSITTLINKDLIISLIPHQLVI